MKFLVTIFTFFVGAQAQADDLQVSASTITYKFVSISAENVQGVNVRLLREVTRRDCNRMSITGVNSILLRGAGEGDSDSYHLTAGGIISTLIGCPAITPVRETVYSQPMFFSATSDNTIEMTLQVPLNDKVEVSEVN